MAICCHGMRSADGEGAVQNSGGDSRQNAAAVRVITAGTLGSGSNVDRAGDVPDSATTGARALSVRGHSLVVSISMQGHLALYQASPRYHDVAKEAAGQRCWHERRNSNIDRHLELFVSVNS